MIMFKFFLSIGMYIIGKWILWYIKKWFCFVFKIKLWSFFVVIFTSQYNVQYGDTKDEEVDVELNRIEKKCFYFWTIKSAMRFMRFIVRKSNKNSIEGHRTWHKKRKVQLFSFISNVGWLSAENMFMRFIFFEFRQFVIIFRSCYLHKTENPLQSIKFHWLLLRW